MSKIVPTPGPWKRGDCDSWIIWAPRHASTDYVNTGATLGDPEAVVVAVVEAKAWAMGGLDPQEREDWLAETDANANLIIAAPDLLEAVRLHVAYESIPADRGGASGRKGEAWAAFIAARDAALAKAEAQP